MMEERWKTKGLYELYVYMDYMGVSKNRGVSPKMDGLNNGKPHFLMDDLGGTTIFGNIHIFSYS